MKAFSSPFQCCIKSPLLFCPLLYFMFQSFGAAGVGVGAGMTRHHKGMLYLLKLKKKPNNQTKNPH